MRASRRLTVNAPKQLHPVAAGQGGGDLVEDGGHDQLDIAAQQMRVRFGEVGDQFGLGHWVAMLVGLVAQTMADGAGRVKESGL